MNRDASGLIQTLAQRLSAAPLVVALTERDEARAIAAQGDTDVRRAMVQLADVLAWLSIDDMGMQSKIIGNARALLAELRSRYPLPSGRAMPEEER